MPLRTTTIGAYPKPEYVRLPDWFTVEGGPDTADPTEPWAAALAALGPDARATIDRGITQAVTDQVEAGIDVPTDGEIPRENYIHYHCRHLEGIDFDRLTETTLRGGAYQARLPTVTGPIGVRDRGFLVEDWRIAQAATDRPVKITLPGPMTITDTTVDAHYGDPARLGADVAEALSVEVRALAEAGCAEIQIDEPLFARQPDAALAFGLENLERAFRGCPPRVTRTMHMCCGYPDRLDNPDYPKADPGAYGRLADAVDVSNVDAVSLEDAHRHNDLRLLERFSQTTVILGVVGVARSRIESVEEIHSRLTAALDHIEAGRLVAAPDCGLGLLGRDRARAKLRNLCEAASTVG